MLKYSEYYNLVSLGLRALQEKTDEAIIFTQQQFREALEREAKAQEQLKAEKQVEEEKSINIEEEKTGD